MENYFNLNVIQVMNITGKFSLLTIMITNTTDKG